MDVHEDVDSSVDVLFASAIDMWLFRYYTGFGPDSEHRLRDRKSVV